MSIKCREIGQNVGDLSGGNKQKVVFGKWLGNESEIYILDCPTRGIDIGVKAFTRAEELNESVLIKKMV